MCAEQMFSWSLISISGFISVREKFGDLRWVPLEPEFLDYPNAQFLMIGEAQNELGKAATAEGAKEPNEQEPGEELERMEQENEHRVEALRGEFPFSRPYDPVTDTVQAMKRSIRISGWMPRSTPKCPAPGTTSPDRGRMSSEP